MKYKYYRYRQKENQLSDNTHLESATVNLLEWNVSE